MIGVQIPNAVEAEPRLRLGQIGERLGFAVSASVLASLGFAPVARDHGAVLYRESDFPSICAALIRRVQAAQAKEA